MMGELTYALENLAWSGFGLVMGYVIGRAERWLDNEAESGDTDA